MLRWKKNHSKSKYKKRDMNLASFHFHTIARVWEPHPVFYEALTWLEEPQWTLSAWEANRTQRSSHASLRSRRRPRDTKIACRRGADEGKPRATAWWHQAKVEYCGSCGVTAGEGASYGVVYIMPTVFVCFSRWKICNVSVWESDIFVIYVSSADNRLAFWKGSYAKWWCAKDMKKIFSKVVTHSTDDTGELELVQLFIHLVTN